MKKALFLSLIFVLFSTMAVYAQITAGGDYLIINNHSNYKIAPISPANKSNLHQIASVEGTSQWRFVDAGGGNFHIKQINANLYISAPAQQSNISGRQLELSNTANANATWKLVAQNGSHRIKNVGNNLFIANNGSSNQGAAIVQTLSPGAGALWNFQQTSGTTTNEELSTPGTPMTSLKEYGTQWLTASKNVGGSQNISQNASINYGYDVKMAYGKPSNGSGVDRKFIVLETHGTQGFDPGQIAQSGETNDKAKFRGYYIESIRTEAKVISGAPTLYASLPPTDAQTGSTGMSQGFSITLSGGAGGEGTTPTGGASLSIGYSMEKFSSLNWTDFVIKENSQPTRSAHEYKLNMLKTIGGGAKPYYDYKDLKNPNNLGIKPLHILPLKAYNTFPLYEWIAFEAPANATGTVTIEVRTDFVVNYVKWTGTQIVQYPETITATKQFTVNLNDVGVINP